jgi:dolichol-phosphate mannosyltransferase
MRQLDSLMTTHDIATALPLAVSGSAPSAIPALRAPELTVVIPTFNERANIAAVVERLRTVLDGVAWEAIFVDDDSPDHTSAVVKEIGAQDPRVRCIRRVGRRGLAGACIEGMLASQAPYVAVMDADLQHDEALLPAMLSILRTGEADIVIGSRHLEGGGADGFSRTRRAGSDIAGTVANRLFRLDVSDPMSGFFMLPRPLAEELAPRLSTQGFKILLDLLVSADTPMRVRELPYRFRARLEGASKLDKRMIMDFAGLLVAKATDDLIPIRFVSFLMVGTAGMMIHILTLKFALLFLDVSFGIGQTIATLVAMTSNFIFNNMLTYRDQRLHGLTAIKGLLLFFVICSVGAVSNIGVANWIYAHEGVWWVAGLSGSVLSAVWNYAISSAVVWRVRN